LRSTHLSKRPHPHRSATAVAARYLGLGCHLVLRTSRALVEGDPGLVGNLLVERLAGAVVHKVGALSRDGLGLAWIGGWGMVCGGKG